MIMIFQIKESNIICEKGEWKRDGLWKWKYLLRLKVFSSYSQNLSGTDVLGVFFFF